MRSTPIISRNAERTGTVVNGNSKRDSLQIKDANKDLRPTRPDTQRYDSNPPKRDTHPQSPHRNIPESKQVKRPLEAGDTSHQEKRTKMGIATSKTPSDSQKAPKTLSSNTKPSPTKAPKAPTSAQASPLPKKGPSTTRPLDTKIHSSKSTGDKPHIPPLLSPLPADITVPAQSNFSSLKKAEGEKSASPKTPSQKPKPIAATGSDTIVVKTRHVKNVPSTSSPRTTPAASIPPFVLPRMLSPSLPEVVEAELTRLQHKKSTPTNNTVEARYEKVRQPGALGVPQKAPRSNIGHPPRKSQPESSHSKKQLIVKMKYKKRQSNDIQRILRLRPTPTDDFKEMEKRRTQPEENYTAPIHFDVDSEEEDVPLSRNHSSKMPANTTSKKRVPRDPKSDSEEGSEPVGTALNVQANRDPKPSENTTARKRPATEADRLEPAQKRPRPSDISITKSSTPIAPTTKSPTVTSSSASRDNRLLSTPKRGEAAKKSTAMGRVMSSDGNQSQARTPKAPAITSTPASSEKIKINGHRPEVDVAQVEYASRQHKTLFNLGTQLKRHLQSKLAGDKSGSVSLTPLTSKLQNPAISQCNDLSTANATQQSSTATSGAERKKAVMKGVESIMAYMLAFHFANQMSTMRGHSILPESWKDLFPVWNFVNSVATPYQELNFLLCNLAAVSREQMCRFFVEAPAESRDNEAFVAAYKDRDKNWLKARQGHSALQILISEGNNILGPWSTVPEAIAFGVAVLEKYAATQKIENWKGEESLKHISTQPPPRLSL